MSRDHAGAEERFQCPCPDDPVLGKALFRMSALRTGRPGDRKGGQADQASAAVGTTVPTRISGIGRYVPYRVRSRRLLGVLEIGWPVLRPRRPRDLFLPRPGEGDP